MKLILEDIVGKQGIVYHRTKAITNLKGIKKIHFNPKYGIRGTGVYFSYTLKDALRENMINHYGKILIKSRIYLDRFLILPEELSKKVHGNNYTLEQQIKQAGVPEDLISNEDVKMLQDLIYKDPENTLDISEMLKGANRDEAYFYKYFDGVIFSQGSTEFGILYYPELLQPIAWAYSPDSSIPNFKMFHTPIDYTTNLKKAQSDILPRYEYIEDFYGNLRIAEVKGKKGIIDNYGKVIIPFEFNVIYLAGSKIVGVKKDREGLSDYLFYTMKGEFIEEKSFKEGLSLEERKAYEERRKIARYVEERLKIFFPNKEYKIDFNEWDEDLNIKIDFPEDSEAFKGIQKTLENFKWEIAKYQGNLYSIYKNKRKR